MGGKSRVSYFYHPDEGDYYYGPGHPMKPQRLKLAHHLILSYGLYRKMDVYRPHFSPPEEMARFHSEEYIRFLQKVNPDNCKQYNKESIKYGVGDFTDSPLFDNVFEFSQISAGASIDGAVKLNHGLTDIAINYAGGLHHAKKSEASGFCYINDIVLAILELLKYHPRVLYIDIDIHHGDGVEEAFYCTDRVMTCSFHKYGDFFPGTGDITDIGLNNGKYYSVNFPLKGGMDDKTYEKVFKPVVSKIMETFRPGAVVLQCGTDSLTGDRLGDFNLTLKGHGECVSYVKSFGIPLLVLGGGGYTIRNVSRCWAYETSLLLDTPISNTIPFNDYFEFFAPTFNLHLTPSSDRPNQNSKEYIEKNKIKIFEHLKALNGAPSVQMQEVPPDYMIDNEDEDDVSPDERNEEIGRRQHDAEFFESEKDVDMQD